MFSNPTTAASTEMDTMSTKLAEVFSGIPSPDPTTPSLSESLSGMGTMASNVAEYSADKLSKITSELPMMQSANAAAATLEATVATQSAALSKTASDTSAAFTAAFADKNTAACPSVLDGFKTLMEGANQAISDLTDSIGSTLNGIPAAIKTAIEAITGPFSDGADMMRKIAELPATAMAQLKASIDAMVLIDPTLIASLQATAANVVSDVTAGLTSLANSIAAEAEAVMQAGKTLLSASFLKLFDAPSDCVLSVLAATTSPNAETQKAISVINTPPARIDSPATNAISVVQSTTTVPATGTVPTTTVVDVGTDKPPVSETFPPNPYSVAELSALQNTLVNVYGADLAAKKKAAGEWWVGTTKPYLDSIGYPAKKLAVGVKSYDDPVQTTDQAAIIAWNEVKPLAKAAADAYANGPMKAMNDADTIVKAAGRELSYRKVYGKTPYTNAASVGKPVPEDQQTTYLDTGK